MDADDEEWTHSESTNSSSDVSIDINAEGQWSRRATRSGNAPGADWEAEIRNHRTLATNSSLNTEERMEENARQQERGVRGYGYEGGIDINDTTTNWSFFADKCLPYCGRILLLSLSCPLLLGSLLASQFSVLAFSEMYDSHAHEFCTLRVASFWCVFGPVAIQFLLIFSRWLCSNERKDPDPKVRAWPISLAELGRRINSRSANGNWNQPVNSSSTRATGIPAASETKSLDTEAMPLNGEFFAVTDRYEQGRPPKQNDTCKIAIQILIDAFLSAVGSMVLMFSVIPFQNWAWTAMYIMLIPFLPNSLEFIHRLCFSPSNKHHRHGMQKLRIACDGFVFLSHCALFAILVYRSFNDSDFTGRGLLVPFSLFGGISILRTRLSDDRSPLNGFNIYGVANTQRLKLASIKLFMEAFILASIGTFVLPLEGSSSWWKSCSTSNLRLLWDYNSMLENRYMILACIHVASSIFAIILARLVSSVRMNLMGLAVPLALYWVSFFIVGILFPDKFPSPFRWGSNLGTQDHAAFIPIICIACIAQSLTTRRIWYELDTSLPLDESVWYTPFFNSLALEQSLLLNRGDKRSSRKRRHMESNVPMNIGAGHEDEQISTLSGHATPGGSSVYTESVASEDAEAERMVLELLDRLDSPPTLAAKRKEQHIVIATSMWHESENEMVQWVRSLARVLEGVIDTAKRYFISPTGVFSRDTYEAHIVMDSAFERPSDFADEVFSECVERRRLNNYAETLLDIISWLIIDIEHEQGENLGDSDEESVSTGREKLQTNQTVTEYGILLKVDLIPSFMKDNIKDAALRQSPLYNELDSPHKQILERYFDVQFPLHIHLKDPVLAKPGKRMNQVLYMNYVIGSLDKSLRDAYTDRGSGSLGVRKIPTLTNTLLLTTDGDTSFDFKNVDVLVDTMVRQEALAGACGRIRPLGSGPLIWYQTFEYACRHWFQKSTEHVMGTAQSGPWSFSIFRLSRLNDILATYSSSSDGSMEYLRKDQGADRWMCTLLIQRGWKLAYCAASVAHLFVPENFDTFFEQRRRWLSSMAANMHDVIVTGSRISSTYGDSALPMFYRIYIVLTFLLALLTPCAIILLVTGGLGLTLTVSTSTGYLISVLPPMTYAALVFCQYYYRVYGAPRCCRRLRARGTNDSLRARLLETSGSAGRNLSMLFKTQQLFLARVLSFLYVFLLVFVFAALLLNAVESFFGVYNIFFLSVIALLVGTVLLHPHDIASVQYAFVYFLGIPIGYLILYMYAVANLNDMGWGTRSGEPKANTNTQYSMFDDPMATGVAIWSKHVPILQSQCNEVLAESLSEYFGVAFVLDGAPTGDTEWYCKSRTEQLAAEMGKQHIKQYNQGDNLCAVVSRDTILLTSLSNCLKMIRRGRHMGNTGMHVQKVILYSDEYAPVLKEINPIRQKELDRLQKWGQNIRQHVLRQNVQEYITSISVHRQRDDTYRYLEVETERQRMARIQGGLDTLRNQTASTMLIVNFILATFVVAMSASNVTVLGSDTAALLLIAICAGVLVTQFLCMIVHRLETLLVSISFLFPFERTVHTFIAERFRDNKLIRRRRHGVGVTQGDGNNTATMGN